MALPNRVDPAGTLHADPARGLFMGNRGGRFHRPDRTLGRRRWAGSRWICCALSYKGRRRAVWDTGYTELFFLDEATALAAGHRPCFECRRSAATAFVAAAHAASAQMPLKDLDRLLHAQRTGPRQEAKPAALPDGAMIATAKGAALIHDAAAHPWSFAGYGPPQPLPARAQVLTPAVTVAALSAGYRPVLHPSVTSRRDVAAAP